MLQGNIRVHNTSAERGVMFYQKMEEKKDLLDHRRCWGGGVLGGGVLFAC